MRDDNKYPLFCNLSFCTHHTPSHPHHHTLTEDLRFCGFAILGKRFKKILNYRPIYSTRREIYNHIITCNEFNYIKNILQLTPYDDTNINCTLTDLIFTNTKIIDKSRHWSLPLYQESIAINRYNLL